MSLSGEITGGHTLPNISGDENDREAKELRGELPEHLRQKLAERTFEGKWEKVVAMYYELPEAHTARINDAMNTALHVAIELDEEDVVRELVNAILTHETRVRELVKAIDTRENRRWPPIEEEEAALEVANERGDTPLHVAASRGFAKLCKCIIGNKGERLYLMRLNNNMGETPLFLAALNWNKEAFVYLSDISKDNVTLDDLVRKNGDSILHSAIKREYFDLAVIIAHRYEGFGISTHTSDDGFTPLKVLATRPSAFKSGSKLSWWKLILYHCIVVEPLDVESMMAKILTKIEQPLSKGMNFPENYAMLCSFCWKAFHVAKLFGKLLLWGNCDEHDVENASKSSQKYQAGSLPPNYATIQHFIRSTYMHSLGLSGVALKEVKKTKKKHQWSRQLLEALMKNPYEAFTGSGGRPIDWHVEPEMYNVFRQSNQGGFESLQDENKPSPAPDSKMGTPRQEDSQKGTKPGDNAMDETDKKETPFLVAARNGITEMVIKIRQLIPSAIHDTNSKKQNVLLVAVKNRQPEVVKALKMSSSKEEVWNNLILAMDDDENTALHLAAKALEREKPWQIAGSALQMMWDIKWYKYIKSIVPHHSYFRSNRLSQTAGQIFKTEHEDLIQKGSDWLKDTSESCSVVAALVAGVSFATASSVPGGTNDEGKPPLEGQPAFDAFAISSLIGLCFSVTGLIMFLSILTSRKEARDFHRGLPLKLLVGLSSLFVSIIAMFVSFCSGHFFIINHKYKTFLFPFYAATSIPVAFYALAQFPLYFDLLAAIITKVPRASDIGDTL